MTKIVTALFERTADGRTAVAELEAIGVPPGEISFIGNQRQEALASEVVEDAGTGAGIGAIAGGVGGLLAGLGIVALPGIGPVVAGGWLVATALGAATGAAVGGAAGGIVGALIDTGESGGEPGFYADGLRRGGTVVSVRIEESLLAQAAAVFARNRALDPSGAVTEPAEPLPAPAYARADALVNRDVFEGRRAA